MSECFLVCYKDEKSNYECEYFGPGRREDAIKYYKTKLALISQNLNDWEKETGVYKCVWRKNEQRRELYLKIIEV